MAKYIECEKVISELESHLINIDKFCDNPYYSARINEGLTKAISVIADTPAADVCPERCGEWQQCDDSLYNCSECGAVVGDNFYKFCPSCGAKMCGKGGESDE